MINLWNASDLNEMALPPCMYDYHFSCIKHIDNVYYVDLHVRARSNDSFLGVPYDFMFCGWFINLICMYLNKFAQTTNTYIPRDIHYTADDYHMYINHKNAVNEYLNNVDKNIGNVISNNKSTMYINPDIFVNEHINSIDDFLYVIDKNVSTKNIQIIQNGNVGDFEYPPIKAEIAI